MKDAGKMILALVLVSAASGGILAAVYDYASPLIEQNDKTALEKAICKVLPGAASYNEIKKGELYKGMDVKGGVAGYAFIAEGAGYQGKIKIIAAIDAGFEKLEGMEILESSETPGLGARITEEGFKGQFRGLPALPEITFTRGAASKDDGVEGITGATISTKSVVGILNRKIAALREEFYKE